MLKVIFCFQFFGQELYGYPAGTEQA